jgi:hypothetical protein
MEVMRFEFARLGDNEERPAYQVQFEIPGYMDVSLEELIYRANQDVKHAVSNSNKYVLVRITKLVDDPSAAIPGYLIKEEYSVVNNKPILQYKQKEADENAVGRAVSGDADDVGMKSIW